MAERQLERASVQGTLFCDIGRTSAGNARQFAEKHGIRLERKTQILTETELERHYPKFVGLLPALEARNSIAKGEDENRREYLLQRSLMYSFYIYNPDSGKFELHNLSRNIKIDIPADRYIQENIIKKAQYYIDRKDRPNDFF